MGASVLLHRRNRRLTATVLAGLTVLVSLSFGLAGGSADASSHREAPLTAADPSIDNTDVYAFTSPDNQNSVTLIANWIPFEEPNGGPNFYPWAAGAHYDINIDNNGDGKADITYRWTFTTQDSRGNNTFLYNNGPVTSLTDPNLLFKQTYTVQQIVAGVATTIGSGTSAPSDAGPASMPNYSALRQQAITPVLGGLGKSYAGQADDPFFLDLRVFDLLYGANLKESGQNTLAGYNVNTIALQVPKTALALNANTTRNPVVGIWSSTEKQTLQLTAGKATPTGPYVQVSRLGNPLVNEVVVPAGLKDAFNSITPDIDHTVTPVVNRVTSPEVPKLIQAIYGIPAPATPRNDLVEIFLTGISKNSGGPIQADLNSQLLNQDVAPANFVPSEELRLNMSVPLTAKPNRLGVLANDLQGFPNGRRLSDDVVDIELQALEGAAQSGKLVPALAAGDGVNANEVPFSSAFPYIALPHNTAVNKGVSTTVAAPTQPGAGGGITLPVGGVDTGAGGTATRSQSIAVPLGASALAALFLGAAYFVRRRQAS